MPIPILDTCCGCIELKSACFIIGYLQLVSEIILTLVVLIFLTAGGVATSSKDEQVEKIGVALLAFGVILTVILALLLAFTITLLVGLHMNKRNHVRAYMIYSTFFSVIGVIMFFASFSLHLGALNYISNFIGLSIHVYFGLVIRSHHHKMDDSNKGAIYNTA